MEVVSSRRLTGPNVIWGRPGAVLDVECTAEAALALVPVWEAAAQQMLVAVGWSGERTASRVVRHGVSLAVSAPVDALYAATEVAEWAFEAAQAALATEEAADFDGAAERLRGLIAEERNPALIALKQAAATHGVAFLSDDDLVSVGMGEGAKTWPASEPPHPRDVDWSVVRDVPVALVTGTNGKTTTVRLAATIARVAGSGVGLTSTEWLSVDGDVIERGDYAGPGGARTVLRQPKVRRAILETARGGLLRRGLGPSHADVVAITTIAEDHLGDFGSADLGELSAIKWALTRALGSQGR